VTFLGSLVLIGYDSCHDINDQQQINSMEIKLCICWRRK